MQLQSATRSLGAGGQIKGMDFMEEGMRGMSLGEEQVLGGGGSTEKNILGRMKKNGWHNKGAVREP